MTKITKAVFPVAGLGTRFLPATKANPKEMLPIVDKPLIQYAVDEAIAAGIRELIFVTSYSKRAIEDHFDSNFELETTLERRGKTELLNIVREVLPEGVDCIYIRQKEALGLGHAVLCAKNIVGKEPFAVLLADDLIDGGAVPCLKQMVAAYQEVASSVIAIQEVLDEDFDKYGIVALEQVKNKALHLIKKIVEKPAKNNAPSNFGVVGRYILSPRIFELLEAIPRGQGNEIQLTDAIAELLVYEKAYAYQFSGVRYDCGSKLGYLQATVAYALKHPELSQEFHQHLLKVTQEPIV